MLLYIVAFALVRYSVFYCCVRRFKVITVFVVNGLTIARLGLRQTLGPEKRLPFPVGLYLTSIQTLKSQLLSAEVVIHQNKYNTIQYNTSLMRN